jgi:hypothetical protein
MYMPDLYGDGIGIFTPRCVKRINVVTGLAEKLWYSGVKNEHSDMLFGEGRGTAKGPQEVGSYVDITSLTKLVGQTSD